MSAASHEVHHLLKLLIHVLVVFNAHWDPDSSGLNANEGTMFGTNSTHVVTSKKSLTPPSCFKMRNST